MPILVTLSVQSWLGSNLECYFRQPRSQGTMLHFRGREGWGEFLGVVPPAIFTSDGILHGDWYRERIHKITRNLIGILKPGLLGRH